MNTKQLQYVLTLAREGSFSRAADTLNISQPSLSTYHPAGEAGYAQKDQEYTKQLQLIHEDDQ